MDATQRIVDLPRTFVAPRGLGTSRPRDVRLTAGGRALLIASVLLFASALAAQIGLSNQVRRQADNQQALEERGVTTTGAVTRLWPNGDDKRKVAYRFTADGRTFDGQIKVSSEQRRALQIGSPIAVRYVPGSPRVNELIGTARSGIPEGLPFVVAGALTTLALLCLFAIHKERRLLMEGRVAPALVTGHKKRHSSHGGTHRSMTYEFPLLSGAVATGKCSTSSKPPAIGSVICVVYDPESPRRSARYPMSLVTPRT